MPILNILKNNVWSQIQSIVLLDLETTKKQIPKFYSKIVKDKKDEVFTKKNEHLYSFQILVAVEIYKNNLELLMHD